MQFDDMQKFETVFFRHIMGMCAIAMLVAIGVYAYLGTFSRYLSDDYCEAVLVNRSSPVNAVIERYKIGEWRAANRYSNLLFVGFGELLGPDNMPITIAFMVVLWAIGLDWGVHEFRKFFNVNWSVQTDLFLGAMLGFFILLQAPNLFQTVYWRSSMMTHFAPLVFGSFLFAFWMKQARFASAVQLASPFPIYLTLFFATFILAGFSEPPVATMVTALCLIILMVWFLGKSPIKQRILVLLAWTFSGAFSGLLAMALSPANAHMVQDATPGVVEILRDSFLFSYIFISFSIKMFLLPTVLSVILPAMLVWQYKQVETSALSDTQKRVIWVMIVAVPLFAWILIAAGFSPSVYGQGFPVERMRFMGRSIMTAAFMLEGASFGLLLQNLQFRFNRVYGRLAVGALFAVIAIVYPLRAAWGVYIDKVPEYRLRAELWDLRDAYIIRHASRGEEDLIVPGLSGVYGIKELDDNQNHWVNVCAAEYYGVNSIRAVPVPDDYIEAYLSE